MNQQHNIAGGEAHDKHDQHSDDEHDGFPPLLRDGRIGHALPESLEHEDVRHDANHSRDHESRRGHRQEVARCHLLLAGLRDVVARVDFEFGNLNLLVVQVERHADDPHYRPNCNRHGHSCTAATLLLAQRVDHGPVTLDTNACDEGDGAVHVAVEKHHQDLAQPLAVGPVVTVEVVRYLERDPDDKEQVGQSQVGHVDGRWMLLLSPEEEDPQGQSIGRKSYRNNNDVDDW